MRRGSIVIGREDFYRLLGIPEGHSVVGVEYGFSSGQVEVWIDGPTMPEFIGMNERIGSRVESRSFLVIEQKE